MLRLHGQNERNRQLIGNYLHSLFPRNLLAKNQEKITWRRRFYSFGLLAKIARKARKLAQQGRVTWGNEKRYPDNWQHSGDQQIENYWVDWILGTENKEPRFNGEEGGGGKQNWVWDHVELNKMQVSLVFVEIFFIF